MLLIKLMMVLLLLGIFYQDMRSRAVYWVLFPLLACAFVLRRLVDGQLIQAVLIESVYPAAFLCIQLSILTLYFSLKRKRLIDLSASLLGLGDVLFLFCLCFYFPFVNFIAFYVGSLAVIIAGWPAVSRIWPQQRHIPLAGLQAAFIVLLICFNINPAADRWFFALISPAHAL